MEQKSSEEFYNANKFILDSAGISDTDLQDIMYTETSAAPAILPQNELCYTLEPQEYKEYDASQEIFAKLQQDIQQFNSGFATMSQFEMAAVIGHLLGVSSPLHTNAGTFNQYVQYFCTWHNMDSTMCFYKKSRILQVPNVGESKWGQ